MPSTLEEFAGNLIHIDRGRRTHTRLESSVLDLREENVHIRIGNSGDELIEDPCCLLGLRPHLLQILTTDRRPHDACVRIDLNTIESTPPDLQCREWLCLVHMLDDLLLTRA